MKLLFDQNLSHRLPVKLADIFADAAHVRQLGMAEATDTTIWHYAQQHGYAIVTQDSDFAERSKLFGSPPHVVWLRCGNVAPVQIETIIRKNAVLIRELMEGRCGGFVELF